MIRFLTIALCFAVHAAAGVVTVPDAYTKMPESETVVWSPLFQATWDAMNAKLGGKPVKTEPPNKIMARLNAFRWEPAQVMPEGSWKTWTGDATPDFLKQVNAEAARMTGEAAGPFELSGKPCPARSLASVCWIGMWSL